MTKLKSFLWSIWIRLRPKTNFRRVQEFHEVFGHPVATSPQLLAPELLESRIAFIWEEFREYCEATLPGIEMTLAETFILNKIHCAIERGLYRNGDVIEAADALTDIQYFTYGAMVCHGFDGDAALKEVHRSNMSKLGSDGKPIYRDSDGKILKGPNYSPPDLAAVLGIK